MRCLSGLVVAFIVFLGCDDGPGEEALAPGEFRLAPSRTEEPLLRQDASGGVIELRGLSLVRQIAAAWDVATQDLDVRIELPPGTFDASARSSDGEIETAKALLRGGFAEHFGMQVRPERRRGDVFVLRLVRGGLVPEPVDAARRHGEPVRARGRYRGAGAPIADLVRYLRNYARRPIVDETRLEGDYDIVLEWDPEAGGRALHVALRDAGLVLAAAQRGFVTQVVEPAP